MKVFTRSPKLVRKSKYVMLFESDWKFELESLVKSLKYFRKLKIVYYALVPGWFLALGFAVYVYLFCLHDRILAVFWVLYLIFFPLANLAASLKPKTYETSMRGLTIDGHLYRWKNFRGYMVKDDRVYLIRSGIAVMGLPKEFEEVIRDFVPKIR